MKQVILNIEGKNQMFLVDDITQKILDSTDYLGMIGKSILQLKKVGNGKESIISDGNGKDILRVQLQRNNIILAIELLD
ncbi:MAG: hypothetical protein ACRCZ0_04385 [Cetobacterium sp.]